MVKEKQNPKRLHQWKNEVDDGRFCYGTVSAASVSLNDAITKFAYLEL